MSIFLSNPKYVAEITNFKIIQNGQIIKTVTLHKNDESSYSSDPFVVPSGQFKIFIEGLDSNGNSILREHKIVPKPSIKPGAYVNVETIEIPDGATQVIFTAKAKKQSLKVFDSSKKEYVGRPLGDGSELEFVSIENPSAGTWTVHSERGFSHSIKIGNANPFDYGFSLGIPNSKEETSKQPVFGKSNHLLGLSCL